MSRYEFIALTISFGTFIITYLMYLKM